MPAPVFEHGRIVAARQITPERWLDALPDSVMPIVLAPGSTRGWFGGRAVVAWSPSLVADGLTLLEAAEEIQRSFDSPEPCLTVALLRYEGSAVVATYSGGVVRTAEGWRVWGALDPNDVRAPQADCRTPLPAAAPLADWVRSDLGGVAYRAGVREVAEAVRAGNVYVLNLTRRLSGDPISRPRDAFAALLARTDSDMAAYWEAPGVVLASASPERFLRVAGDRVEVCPIKGTRPRAEGAADAAMAAELADSEKERAEHVMIVDLERNDIGRVCRPGSIAVDPLFEVVATPYCYQMISTVSGHLRPDASIADLLEAAFPCGSITGAPKIAAMRMIAALEASPRSAYTGSLVVSVPGELDSSVLIRTAEYAEGGVSWGTGAGITVDSDPAEEWLETLLKASPFLGDSLPLVALRETCRVVRGRVPLLARHLGRLAAAGCGPAVLARVRAEVADALSMYGSAADYGRLSVTVRPTGDVTAGVTDAASSLDAQGGPVLMAVESQVPRLPTGAAKPADRALWDAAQQRAVA
ncbi:MAG TPA: bifunctional anthranilate synthase component I family protein/class IV aminotransferase, partial [Coriobacteriia bacterium]|nr:bifunctional anthranilate synthase component I family protein/class IV aminotransferase [Coriobacteriia bacterium]